MSLSIWKKTHCQNCLWDNFGDFHELQHVFPIKWLRKPVLTLPRWFSTLLYTPLNYDIEECKLAATCTLDSRQGRWLHNEFLLKRKRELFTNSLDTNSILNPTGNIMLPTILKVSHDLRNLMFRERRVNTLNTFQSWPSQISPFAMAGRKHKSNLF